MSDDRDAEGRRLLDEWLRAENELRTFVGTGHALSRVDPVIPKTITQAYLDRFDALVKARDATESAYRAWLSEGMSRTA